MFSLTLLVECPLGIHPQTFVEHDHLHHTPHTVACTPNLDQQPGERERERERVSNTVPGGPTVASSLLCSTLDPMTPLAQIMIEKDLSNHLLYILPWNMWLHCALKSCEKIIHILILLLFTSKSGASVSRTSIL